MPHQGYSLKNKYFVILTISNSDIKVLMILAAGVHPNLYLEIQQLKCSFFKSFQ